MSDAHLDPLMHVAQTDHPDPIGQARAAAGRSIRDIGHALVGHHAAQELLDEVASTLDALTARLDQGTPRTRGEVRRDGQFGEPPPDGAIMTSYDERPISGRASPWGLDIEVRRAGKDAVASLTLRAAHEGAPERSHGGIVAALFDDVFGFVLQVNALSAFTGELWVRYEAGVPIGVPLLCRVRLDRHDGRKLYMTGELVVAETERVLARSTATFITIDPSRFNPTAAAAR
ncbi:MAG: PaaI family thioesterase [Ilumatobacteraceae bacterium]